MSKFKHKEDASLMMIFVVVIGIVLLSISYTGSRCDAIGNCQEVDQYAID